MKESVENECFISFVASPAICVAMWKKKRRKKEKGNYVMYIGSCTFECVKILTPIPFLGSLPDIFIISTFLRFDLLCRLIY